MNNKILLGVFALLLVLYLASKMFGGNKKSSFDPQVIMIDTSTVDRIVIHPKGNPGESFSLEKSEGKWMGKKGALEVEAIEGAVTSLKNQMTNIRAKRIVSKTPDKWAGYEVDETSGTRVEVFGNGKSIEDFIVGAFKYDQTTQAASSYIRRTDEDEVYVVDGFLSMQFNQQFDNFRNKDVLALNQDDITKLNFTEDGAQISVQKSDGSWYYGGMEEIDSTLMMGYLGGLSSVKGGEFLDGFDPSSTQILYELDIEANNLMGSLKVRAYQNTNNEFQYVIHSTLNPDAYFLSDSTGIYDRIFGKLKNLLPQ